MQRFILLSALILPIFILSSVVYVYDNDTGESLSIVKIEENGITRQVLTPFYADSDSITVGLVGYRDTVVSLTADTLHIALSPVSFIEDTITVRGMKFTPDRQTIDAGSDPESALRGLSYMLDVRKYSNTLSVSMDGSTAEQTGITLNGFEIINPAAGVIDPELVPIIQSESVSITRNAAHRSITGRFRGSIDITMPRTSNGLYLEAGRNITAGGFAGFGGLMAGFICSRKKDMILPDGSILANSHSRLMKTYFRFEQPGFNMLYLSSRKRAGDPGPEGSAFLNAYTVQNLKHIQISSMIESVSVKFALNDHFFHYINPEIGEGIDSRSHAGSMYVTASGNLYLGTLGLSVIHDYIDSDNTSSRSRFRGGINWEYEKGQWQLSVNSCIPQTVRTNIMRETHSGSIMKQRGISFYMREPTFNELYWTGDPYASGNPQLSSEKVTSVYCNILHSQGSRLIAFESGLDIAFDLINWENVMGIYRPVNNQRVIRPRAGLIFSDRWEMLSVDSYLRFKPSVMDNVSDYSEFFSDILDLEAGHISNYYSILPYDPVMKFGLDLGVHIGDFFLYTGSRIESRRYINDYNTKYINGFMQITETGVRFSHEQIKASVAVNNPLNSRFEDIRGYPREGRTFKFTLILEDL